MLCWAGTMPVVLLASFYAPVYDATLMVLSGFLVAGVVYRTGRPELIRSFEAMVLLVYLGAIVSQPIARVLHLQVFTIILALNAIYIFSLRVSDSNTGSFLLLSPTDASINPSIAERIEA